MQNHRTRNKRAINARAPTAPPMAAAGVADICKRNSLSSMLNSYLLPCDDSVEKHENVGKITKKNKEKTRQNKTKSGDNL